MIDTHQLLGFSVVALIMVLSPGPNMIYLISRSIYQGRKAGFISLVGVALGFIFYMVCTAMGITALLFAVPYAYDVIRILGAIYLLWLAWTTYKKQEVSIFAVQKLSEDSSIKLFCMGFLTNLLNPKIAMMYLSLLPQFIQPSNGSIFFQSFFLGMIQILISLSVNSFIIFSAGSIALFLNRKPQWIKVQKWMMSTVLAGLAIKLLTESKH